VEIAYCLDTSAYSHFARGSASAVEVIRTAGRLVVPVIVLAELRAGFANGKRATERERMLKKFMAHPVVELTEVDERASVLWAEIWSDQKRRGRPVGTNDMWIAAIAAKEGLPVLTADEDFANITRVSLKLLAK
jgi:tRNA(fMet)-specific endonuclease VapC